MKPLDRRSRNYVAVSTVFRRNYVTIQEKKLRIMLQRRQRNLRGQLVCHLS